LRLAFNEDAMRASKSYSDPGLENGFNSLIGFELIEWRSDLAVLELVIQSKHLNRSGVIHGGVLATMIDAACGYAGCYCETPGNVRAALTLSLTTSYLGSFLPAYCTALPKSAAAEGASSMLPQKF
jgi:uncharacterized protein (TIGR00369 family)